MHSSKRSRNFRINNLPIKMYHMTWCWSSTGGLYLHFVTRVFIHVTVIIRTGSWSAGWVVSENLKFLENFTFSRFVNNYLMTYLINIVNLKRYKNRVKKFFWLPTKWFLLRVVVSRRFIFWMKKERVEETRLNPDEA